MLAQLIKTIKAIVFTRSINIPGEELGKKTKLAINISGTRSLGSYCKRTTVLDLRVFLSLLNMFMHPSQDGPITVSARTSRRDRGC